MAGDWIKIRHDLEEEPEVVQMVSAMCPQSVRDLSARMRTTTLVCGALQRTWRLFDKLTDDGILAGYSAEWLDGYVGLEGFSDILQRVGWLEVRAESLVVPGFVTHMGDSAKRRLKDAQRKRTARQKASAKRPKKNGQKADQRREEKRRVNKETKAKKDAADGDDARRLVTLWNDTKGAVPIRKLTDQRRRQLRRRLAERDWPWLDALAKFPLRCFEGQQYTPTLDFFLRPDTVAKILEGAYDWQPGADGPSGPTRTAAELATEWEAGRAEQARRRQQRATEQLRRRYPGVDVARAPF